MIEAEALDTDTGAVFRRALREAAFASKHHFAVILVEGLSDRAAVETLANRRGRDLARDHVAVLAMGGVTNYARFIDLLGPDGADLAVAGIYDLAEASTVRNSLSTGGYDLGESTLEDHGFFAANLDLEDELIRALGPGRVQDVIVTQGELRRWLSFQNQPAQRDRPIIDQLHRFIGTKSGRKVRFGSALVEALDLDHIPPPLEQVLAQV